MGLPSRTIVREGSLRLGRRFLIQVSPARASVEQHFWPVLACYTANHIFQLFQDIEFG